MSSTKLRLCDPCSSFHRLNCLCCCNVAYLSRMNTIIITIIKEKERNRLEEFYLQRIILAPQGLGLPERTSLSTKG